ncbi:MAG: LacI family DNA-binding transcriptional regulator [Lachnospiraceae bacterium]|nr:LacI family DNA-binding transcriptional regulator [Lachnospiraceae bacterium]
MASLKDVARECNVSVATVSKALNGHSDVGAATAKRIRETAKNMGYLPNTAARALKTNRTYNLGVIFSDEAHSGLTHSYFSNVLEGFRKSAEDRDYDITFISNNHTVHDLSYYERCRSRGVDGIVIACMSNDTVQIEEMITGSIPVVTIDRVFNECSSVVSDNAKGMEELVEYAIARGHRKIAYIHGKPSATTSARLTSYRSTLKKHGIEPDESMILEADYLDADACFECTRQLLSAQDKPTCIIYPDDLAAMGGIRAITDMGLTIPGDISVMGYDGARLGQVITPRLTTILQDTASIGGLAAQKLIERIENQEGAHTESILVAGQLIEGDSVGELV